jgi:hemerythrin
MTPIEWKSRLVLGIEKIDEQHRQMVQMIQEFSAAVQVGQATDTLEGLLENMFNYAQIHFATEEALLRRCECPELIRQEAQHEEYVLKVEEFRNKLRAGRFNLDQELVESLANWWTNHIEVEDKKFVKFVKRSGLG